MPSILLELESILLYSYGQIHYSMAGRVRGLSSCLCGNYYYIIYFQIIFITYELCTYAGTRIRKSIYAYIKRISNSYILSFSISITIKYI